MAKKDFKPIADICIDEMVETEKSATAISEKAVKEAAKAKASSLLVDILRESKKNRKSLVLRDSTLDFALKEAKKQGKSFNDYIEELIIKEMQR